jgi:hypothetical protein
VEGFDVEGVDVLRQGRVEEEEEGCMEERTEGGGGELY